MSWCSWSLGGWALLHWAQQAVCSGSGTLCGEIWRIGTTRACSTCIRKREPSWPHCSYYPWIYQHPSENALQFIRSIVGILGVAVPQYGISLFPCFRTSLLYSQFIEPGRTNQSINKMQSWQGKAVTGSLLQTELHSQCHNCFGTLQPNMQWTAAIHLPFFNTNTILNPKYAIYTCQPCQHFSPAHI